MPAKTVEDILRETGFTDEQIKAIDAKAMTALNTYGASANTNLEKAELALRAQREEYDTRIAPALANWADRDTRVSTENAAYREFITKMKDSGYLPPEMLAAIPTFGAPAAAAAPGTRGPDGRFVAGGNTVPGSPGPGPAPGPDLTRVHADLQNEMGRAFAFGMDTQWRYRSLFGKEMPDSPTQLIREATQNHMDPSAWAAKKYDFTGRETAIRAEEQKKHDDAIRKETADAKDREWGEKISSNPNVRLPQESAFAQISKARADGKRADPLKMTAEERKVSTHSAIQKEFQERSSGMVQ